MRDATLAWSAAAEGAGVVGCIEKLPLEAWSSAADEAKSAANISRVRFEDDLISCSAVLGSREAAVSAMVTT
jgi:hypothetical protein